jgi:hypothetical protein
MSEIRSLLSLACRAAKVLVAEDGGCCAETLLEF